MGLGLQPVGAQWPASAEGWYKCARQHFQAAMGAASGLQSSPRHPTVDRTPAATGYILSLIHI